MKILAIETSCDDTCVAVIKTSNKKEVRFDILSNVVSSQIEIHKKYGGVYPTLAKREHQKNLVPVLIKALKEAKILKTQNAELKAQNYNAKLKTLEKILSREEYLLKELKKFLTKYKKPKIGAIAVTIGPGLEPCLWTGVNFALALGYFWNLQIVPVNHIEAHIIANWLSPISSKSKIKNQKLKIIFPAICLVVSGGHTQLILMRNFARYKIIGETRDDAAGECFDKTARILGLGYPGGPAIAKKASQWKSKANRERVSVSLPRPMIEQKNYDFSFSGLKTAVLYDYKKRSSKVRKSKKYIQKMAREIQQAVIDVLIKKTIKAAENYKAKTILLGGGVAANGELRKQLKEKIKKEIPTIECLIPDVKHCTDNAAMVGITSYFNYRKAKKSWEKIEAQANLRLK